MATVQHWFVYYKVDADAVPALAPRLRRMQEEVLAATGARPRLLRRAGGEQVTLLEVYDDVAAPERFEAALSAAVGRAGLPASLQRRTERFEDC
jgi:hypothetical protein